MEIQLKKSDILEIGIKDEKGNPTGEYLTFDFGDTSLPLKYQQMVEDYQKNRVYVQNQFRIIDKKQDHKGKKLLSANEEAKIKVLNEFYKKQMEVYDRFLGKDGCKKLLNGRSPYWEMFEDINECIEPIVPKIYETIDNMKARIMGKYKTKKDEGETLE